jgi:hypothetical protein
MTSKQEMQALIELASNAKLKMAYRNNADTITNDIKDHKLMILTPNMQKSNKNKAMIATPNTNKITANKGLIMTPNMKKAS